MFMSCELHSAIVYRAEQVGRSVFCHLKTSKPAENISSRYSFKMTDKIDSVYRTRSLGVAARGIPDQYADGKAAKVWTKYVGDQKKRTGFYREKLLQILKDHGVRTVFDVACGTGYAH